MEGRSMGIGAAIQGSSTMIGARRNGESVPARASTWDGPARVKLVKEGYGALAVMCTFIAGVQAQFISISLSQMGPGSEVVNAFFFAGLFADIGAAILSIASARWYEMLTPNEAEHAYDWLRDSSSGGAQSSEPDEEKMLASNLTPYSLHITERWLHIALKAGPVVAILGLSFLLAGVMVLVWKRQKVAVYTLCTILCALLVILLPPFVIPHDRIKTLRFVKLKRYSGSG